MSELKKEYEPFSKEWEKELNKWSKSELIHLIRAIQAEKQTSWIKVSDRLPKERCKIICYSEEGSMSIEQFNKGKTEIYCDQTDSGYATHWMPLPEPPKED